MSNSTLKDLRKRILEIEKLTRDLQTEYDNKYAQAHLREINLQAQLMLIQLDYAKLAQADQRRDLVQLDDDGYIVPILKDYGGYDPYGGKQ